MPVEEHPHQHGDGTGYGGVGEGVGGESVAGVGSARIEAEPAEPQQTRAHGHERQIVGLGMRPRSHVVAATEKEHGGERRKTGVHMHHYAAGKVHHAESARNPPPQIQ